MNAQNRQPWSGRGTLQNLVEELNRQKESRVDFVADTRNLKIVAANNGKGLGIEATTDESREWLIEPAVINPLALRQVAEKCAPSVPVTFMEKLIEQRNPRAVELLNGLWQDSPAKRFVRCLDGNVRAFLSNSYRVIDNFDLAFSALDAVKQSGGNVLEASLSDSHMRLKFTSTEVWDTINEAQHHVRGLKAGSQANETRFRGIHAHTFLSNKDLPGGSGTVHPLVTISNSETGHGGLRVKIGIFRSACINGVIMDETVSHIHLGETMNEGIFTMETVSAESKTIYLKARDAIKAAFNPDHFKRMVAIANNAQEQTIAKPAAAVANIAEAVGLDDSAKDNLLSYFMADYTPTRYGLANATARLAQDFDSGDRATELEDIAGKIMRGDLALA